MLSEQRPPNEKPIERLIYDLRDVNTIQCFQPSMKLNVVTRTNIYTDMDGKPLPNEMATKLKARRNAAQILVDDVGYDAIPYLIDHLDDETLTRSVHYWRDTVYAHNILTVGECCTQILDTIMALLEYLTLTKTPLPQRLR